MKRIIAALAASAALTGVALPSPADARDGCGAGFYRGPAGRCRPTIGSNRVVIAPGLVIGRYYERRGYWDGRRYWKYRYRHHNGWRYR